MRTALVPGSFDPITLGHYDIVKRSALLFDRVIVTIFHNSSKQGLFPIEKRLEFLRLTFADLPNVEVDTSESLLAEYVEQKKIDAVIKGVRNGTDFDYEYAMALMNQSISSKVETLFLPARNEHQYICSSLVRELLHYNKPVTAYLPKPIHPFFALNASKND